MGGIVWRIASDFLDVRDGMAGPTSQCHIGPQRVKSKASGNTHFIDDGLSEEECMIITGVYAVGHGSE